MDSVRVGIIGTGYVGLVSGACFGELGFQVTCGDVIEEKVNLINMGKPPIYENGLDDLLPVLVSKKLLRASLKTNDVVENSDVIFICTGTPSREDGSIDLTYIKSATEDIGSALRNTNQYKTIIVKSTVVPGTTESFVKSILEEKSGKKCGDEFGLGMNPEFLMEGIAMEDFKNPDRIVIGAVNDRSYSMISQLYDSFTCPIMRVSPTTAEMIKYASNSFLALKISFINELANLSEKIGADISQVAEGMGYDKRISPKFLRPGVGFGGSCFPKDVKALANLAKVNGMESLTLNAALNVNLVQPKRAVTHLKELMDVKDKTIGLLGLAFKPETDDMREAPSATIANELLKEGAHVIGYDPVANENARRYLPKGVNVVESADEVLKQSDGVILVTEWNEFRNMPISKFESMKGRIIVDGRRVLSAEKFREAGFQIRILGTKPSQ